MERSVLISFDPTVLEKLKSNRHVRTGLLIADDSGGIHGATA